jgi:predicted dehydrogenase
MDYTVKSLSFKIKKAVRYMKLYGPRRTWVKIQGQYHMKRRYDKLPHLAEQPELGGHVGIIGCGNFSYSNIAYFLNKNYGRVIRAAMDIDIHRAASLYERYGLRYYTHKSESLLSDPAIDLIYISSNHASHAEYAVRSLDSGKSVHIEKPHVVSEDQLLRLCLSMVRSEGKVALGFNRPQSKFFHILKEALGRQEGPLMMNWFIAGHEIAPDHWYFKSEEGGRVLGNVCHWTDFIYQLVPSESRYPITITPTRGDKPDCDIAVTFLFGDGSIGAITFSAKGHTFEGVKERFAVHKGNCLVSIDDFKTLVIEEMAIKRVYSPLFRDHGHEENICHSYRMLRAREEEFGACSIQYIWETGMLFLKTREALEKNKKLMLTPFDETVLKAMPISKLPNVNP